MGIFKRNDGQYEPTDHWTWSGPTCDGCGATGSSADLKPNSSGDQMCKVCRASGLG
ncbi:hypothetical protein ACFW31_24595 [Nocardiopsis alba]|uniref:hypothetical protein n=1 Tax=Nocardiopsis alba TaxID=53437 RepID=UPI00366C8662